MTKYVLLWILVLTLTWCLTPQLTEEEILREQKLQQAIEAKNVEERKILEAEREKARLIREKEIAQEQQYKDELLKDDLLKQTALLNSQALDVLNSKSQLSQGDSEFDLVSDNSLTRFVNNNISYTDLEYIPENLVNMEWEYIQDAKGGSQLRKEALDALDDLAQNYYLRFWEKLSVVSAYRSYTYQKGIKDRWCDDTLCAKAGYSEHQSGLAVDFWETTEEKRFREDEKLKSYFEWMKQEWHKFWFTNTYQKWVEIDWYQIEPWHWRYVWEDLALILHEYNITFSEYMQSPENY